MEPELKFGIAGTGSRGILSFGYLLNLRKDVKIQALADVNPERLRRAANILGGSPSCYPSVEAMLQAEALDAVIVTTPDFTHEAVALAALQAGVHALVDKPLATTVRGCQNIIAAAETANRILMIGFNLRHHPVLKRLKQLVNEGALGQVHLIENREFYDGGRTYMSRWNRYYEKSGGLWIHKGSHDFDVFQWLLDFPRPVRVSATAGLNILNAGHLPFRLRDGVKAGPCCRQCPYASECPDCYRLEGTDAEIFDLAAAEQDNYYKDCCMYLSDKSVHDNGIAIVEYENGARASHLESFIGSICDRKYTLVGDRGIAEASLTEQRIVLYPRWSREKITYEIPEADGSHGGADPLLLDAFIRAVRGETANTSTARHGMWATAVGQAAELSWREGRSVEISSLLEGGQL